MKYRKKPVEIEARQWEGGAAAATPIINWILENEGTARWHDAVGQAPDQISIDTLEGTMYANPGDFIIMGVAREFYPCKPDIFEQTYEDADDNGTNHAATAEARLEFTLDELRNGDIEDAQGHAAFAAAQVSATLALVEQQRIANLIALMQMQAEIDESTDLLAGEAMHSLIERKRTPATPFSGPDEVPVIRPEIREALGL